MRERGSTGTWSDGRATRDSISIWLRLSLPIALLATAGSLVGILFDESIYGQETANWAAQSVGQDIANLIAFPALLVAAFFAARGSMRAYLVWLGLLVYSAYTYAIYSFALHFGPLFLVWVATFGLSIYALIGGLTALDVKRVKSAFTDADRTRLPSRLLIAIGSIFTLLWLSEIVPAIVAGETPVGLKEVGLLTNPVHVLDLGILLPGVVIGGLLLSRGRALGYVLAPMMLVATFFLAVGIVSLTVVSATRGLDASPAVGGAVAALAVLEAGTVVRLLLRMDRGTRVEEVLHLQPEQAPQSPVVDATSAA